MSARRLARRAVLAAQRDGAVQRARRAWCAEENARRGYDEVKTPILSDVELWRRPATGTSTATTCTSSRVRGPRVRAQADELPGPHPDLRAPSAAPTATCRSATPRPGSCTATSLGRAARAPARARSSPRTTPTSSAREEQIEEEVVGCLDLGFAALRALRLRSRGSSSRRGPRSASAPTRSWDHAEARARASAMRRRGSSTRSTRATARSTARRSTCT